jgi:lipoprotein-anchoring transpeptidase ErfK/SrfK
MPIAPTARRRAPDTPRAARTDRSAMRSTCLVTTLLLFASACGGDNPEREANDRSAGVATSWGYDTESAEEIERGRRDPAWRQVFTFAAPTDTGDAAFPEDLDRITADAVNRGPMHLPIRTDAEGPSVVRAQVLLDRALFSPGVIDGRWGANGEKAVYWFQHREGLRTTGELDRETFERLAEVARAPDELVASHALTEDDVAGPFVTIPDDIYEHAELDCSCYTSLSEKLGERFHTHPDLLARLNPDADLDALRAGDRIRVPRIRDSNAAINQGVARLVISDNGRFLHALDADDRIVMHFPSTLGSSYDPSPIGELTVTSITKEPWWHYQPDILEHVDSSEPDAHIPPGPNSAVGMVWMALSEPHYGIHGTARPETIGYATSAGCVRLTNWDALFLARRIGEGTRVTFRDTDAPGTSAPSAR